MGKIIEIKMGNYFSEKVARPIRNKQDSILILLETLKQLSYLPNDITNEKGKIIICIDKMSRVFYEIENKIFSITFPFSLESQENGYKIYDSITDLEINEKMISLLISIFAKKGVLDNSLEMAFDYIIELANEYDYNNIDNIWKILFKLWYMEEGYIRYDYDLIHENGKLHPVNHLDINYSSGCQYKIGLKRNIILDEFKSILDIKTDCAYLEL